MPGQTNVDAAATPISRKSSSFDRNLKSLQRLDGAVNTIVCMAPHVVVYTMNETELTWYREDIEGTLFLVSRTAEPWHSLIVMNRQNTNNMCQSLDDMFQYEVNGPYVMFRNSEGVRSFWFPQENDKTSLVNSLTSTFAPPLAIDKATPNPNAPPGTATSPHKSSSNSNSNNNSSNAPTTPVRKTASKAAMLLTPDLLAQRRPQLPDAMPSLDDDDKADGGKVAAAAAAAAVIVNKTQTKTTGQTVEDLVLGKKDLQDIMIKLIKNDQFISVLHTEYLKTTTGGGRSRTNSTVSNTTTQSAPAAQPAAQHQQQQHQQPQQQQQRPQPQQYQQQQQQAQLHQAQAQARQQQHVPPPQHARPAGPQQQQPPPHQQAQHARPHQQQQQQPRPQHPAQQQQQHQGQPPMVMQQHPRGPPRPHGMPGAPGQVPYGYPMPIPGQHPQHPPQPHQQPPTGPSGYGPPPAGVYWNPPPVPGSGGAQQHAHYQQQMRAAGVPPAPRGAMPVPAAVPVAQGGGPRGPPHATQPRPTYIPVAVPASQAPSAQQARPTYAQAPPARPPQ